MSAELKEGYKKRKNAQKERKERLSEIKKRRMKGERNGRTEEWQRGRKEKMGEKIEGWEEGEEKMEKKKGEGPGCRTSLTLVLLDLPFLYLFSFYFQNISWCLTPPSTQFPACGCTSRKLCVNHFQCRFASLVGTHHLRPVQSHQSWEVRPRKTALHGPGMRALEDVWA